MKILAESPTSCGWCAKKTQFLIKFLIFLHFLLAKSDNMRDNKGAWMSFRPSNTMTITYFGTSVEKQSRKTLGANPFGNEWYASQLHIYLLAEGMFMPFFYV